MYILVIHKFEVYITQHCSFNFGIMYDLAGRLSAQAGFILYSKKMSAPMLHIAMISKKKELAMALYENQTFVSWSPLLSCFIGSMDANKSLQFTSSFKFT